MERIDQHIEGEDVENETIPTLCPYCYRKIGQTSWCPVCRSYLAQQAIEQQEEKR